MKYVVVRKGSKSEIMPEKCSLRFDSKRSAKAFRNQSKKPMMLKVIELEVKNET